MNSEDKAKSPLTGLLVVPKVDETVKFVSEVFGGTERERYQAREGKTWYSVMEVLGTPLNLMEQFPSMGLYAPSYRPSVGGDTSMLAVSVKDVDATYKHAIASGATSILEPHNAYWGDRYAEFRSPSGVRFACCGVVDKSQELVDPAETKVLFEKFQAEHHNPTTPAKIVGVNTAAIVNAVPQAHIAFAANGTSLTAKSKVDLAIVADFLKESPEKHIVIVGHTDTSSAPEGEQMKISVSLAEAVAKELTGTYGIAASRLKTQGAGGLSPIASNSTEAGRTHNRRVTFADA